MNMRNGIPIVQPKRNNVWKADKNVNKRYIEMGMKIAESHCYASVVMPYKFEWVQEYLAEGWTILKEWTTDAVN